MQRADNRVFVTRSALFAALLLAMAAPACDGKDPGPRQPGGAPVQNSGGSFNEPDSSSPPEGGADDPAAEAPSMMPNGGASKGGSSSKGGSTNGGSSNKGGSSNGGSSSKGGSGGSTNGGSNSGGSGGGHAGTSTGGGGQMGGGTAGTAGTGMTDTLKVCDACESKCKRWAAADAAAGPLGFGTNFCLNGPGTAQAGPAKSVELSVLCAELLDCMVRSDCYKHEVDACYCGTSGVACQTGGANGDCRDQMEAAAESDQIGDIGARLSDPAYAIGRASLVEQCYRSECPQACGLDPM